MEETLGKRIVAHRKRLGLTQDQLAEQLGVTAQAVSKWENDQSCPDIAMLPKLAEIFDTSTDELLGVEKKPVKEAELIPAEAPLGEQKADGSWDAGTWEFKLDNSRKGHLGMAVLVLLVGGLLLAGQFLDWNISFWGILWPSILLVFGLFGVLPKPSFFRIGCLFFGVYFLLDALNMLPEVLGRGIVFPLILVVFGISLLADALRKPRKGRFHLIHNGKTIADSSRSYSTTEGESFACATSFGENYREIALPRLSSGSADVSFGELTVDLTKCGEIADGTCIDLNCAFGELELRVPGCCRLEPDSSTVFGSVEVKGSPAPDAAVTVYVKCDVSFGEIELRYI